MRPLFRYAMVGIVAIAIGIAVSRLFPSRNTPPPAQQSKEAQRQTSVEMTDAQIKTAGIELEKAGSATLKNVLRLNGALQANQEALTQVTPRFPGIVRNVRKRIGDHVQKGDVLAAIESNQSLTVYELQAPFAGTVTERQATLGEYVSEQKPAFVIADLSTVWIDLSVYRRDLKQVHVGDAVLVDVEDGGPAVATKISYLSPIGASDTQSALARAVADNPDGRLRPGLFVSARLILPPQTIPRAVKLSALQTLENRTVVFVRSGDKFEAREVQLGERDKQHVEVVSGLEEGDLYAAKNSFVIKSELAKGAADAE